MAKYWGLNVGKLWEKLKIVFSETSFSFNIYFSPY